MPRGKKKTNRELLAEDSASVNSDSALEEVLPEPLTLDVGYVELLETEFDPDRMRSYNYDIKGVIFRDGKKYISIEVYGDKQHDYN